MPPYPSLNPSSLGAGGSLGPLIHKIRGSHDDLSPEVSTILACRINWQNECLVTVYQFRAKCHQGKIIMLGFSQQTKLSARVITRPGGWLASFYLGRPSAGMRSTELAERP